MRSHLLHWLLWLSAVGAGAPLWALAVALAYAVTGGASYPDDVRVVAGITSALVAVVGGDLLRQLWESRPWLGWEYGAAAGGVAARR